MTRTTRLLGRPDTTIIAFKSGSLRNANIDAQFDQGDGRDVLIQPSSADGEEWINTNRYISGSCDRADTDDQRR